MNPTAPKDLAESPTQVAADVPLEFEAVYEGHVEFVRCNVRRMGVDEAFADDVVQRVFLVVHRRLQEFEHRSSIKTWLLAIVLRVVREERRSLRRRLAHWLRGSAVDPDELPYRGGATPLDQLSQAEASDTVQRLLEELPPDKREVFVLAELEEMTAREIAEITGLETSAVYSRLRAARTDFERAAKQLRRAERLTVR